MAERRAPSAGRLRLRSRAEMRAAARRDPCHRTAWRYYLAGVLTGAGFALVFAGPFWLAVPLFAVGGVATAELDRRRIARYSPAQDHVLDAVGFHPDRPPVGGEDGT